MLTPAAAVLQAGQAGQILLALALMRALNEAVALIPTAAGGQAGPLRSPGPYLCAQARR